jgi:hypothetical protein
MVEESQICEKENSDLRMSVHNGLLSKIRIEPTAPIIRTKQAAREVNGQNVELLVMGYTDRIVINVTTEGKLGQIVFLFSLVLG